MPAEVIRTRRTTILRHHEEEVKIKSIVILPESFQTRETLDKGRSLRYGRAFQSGSVFPPVILKELPDGRRILVDGFHRVDFHIALGLSTIKAVIEPADPDDPYCGPEAQGILRGIQANMDQSKDVVVTEKDRFHAAKIMIRNEQLRIWSDKHISNKCGISSQSVRTIRRELQESEGIPIPDMVWRFDKDGKPQWMVSYYTRKSGGSPKLLRSGRDRKPAASLGGKLVYLPGDTGEAQNRIDIYVSERDRIVATMKRDIKHFGMWLHSRGVQVDPNVSGQRWMGGGLKAGETIFVPIPDYGDIESVRSAFCKAFFLLKCVAGLKKAVLVTFRKEIRAPASMLATAIEQCDLPIVFMDPWEIVDAFREGPDELDGPTPDEMAELYAPQEGQAEPEPDKA